MTDTITITTPKQLRHYLSLQGTIIAERKRTSGKRVTYTVILNPASIEARYIRIPPRLFHALYEDIDMIRHGVGNNTYYWVYQLKKGQ